MRYIDVSCKELKFLDLTSLTVEEFTQLVPAFEEAFQARIKDWCLDGKKRTGRKYTTYTNCPLPTPEDRLLFILVYLKTNPLQVAHGLMFGLPQGKTNQWLHLLLPFVRQALRELGDAPSRTLKELAQRLALGVAEVEQATAPLFAMMEPNDPSRAPKTRLNRKASIAARRKAIG